MVHSLKNEISILEKLQRLFEQRQDLRTLGQPEDEVQEEIDYRMDELRSAAKSAVAQ